MSDERLPPKLELLLAAERAAAPPDGERDEVAVRLAKTLGLATLAGSAAVGGAHAVHAATVANAGAGGTQAANVATGGAKAIVAKSVVAKIIVAVIAGGVTVSAGVGAVRLARRHHHVNTRRVVAAPAAATATSPITTPAPPPETTTENPQQAVAPSTPPAATEPHRSRHSDLIAERSMLTEARSAMQSRDTARALTILNEHTRRFPRGQLVEERDALEVVALANSGDQKRARVRANEFVRRHPNSLFLPSVQQAATEPGAGAQ